MLVNKNIVLKEFLISAKPGSSLATKLHNHYGPKWDKSFILDINKYDYWVENLDVGNKVFSLRYLHFNFTHFPVDFDTHCIYRSDVKIWHDKHQNEDGMRSEATCALTKFSKLLQKMKLMGIYDQTLVVFKSDHGQPTNYYSNFPNNLLINGGTPWGYSRYRPTLMLKDFGAQNTTISYNEDLVLLNDLAKTLCVSSSLNIDCDPLHGQNILNRENKDKDQSYYIYVPENSKSDFNFENHVSIMIPTRKMDFLKALEVAPLVSLSFSANSADSGR